MNGAKFPPSKPILAHLLKNPRSGIFACVRCPHLANTVKTSPVKSSRDPVRRPFLAPSHFPEIQSPALFF